MTALVALPWVLSCATAYADGPHIAFHGTEAAYTVTLFSAPDPLVTGPAELTLLIQNASDSSLAHVSSVSGQLVLQGHTPVLFTLTQGGAANRELLGATVQLPDAGTYVLILKIAKPGTSMGTASESGPGAASFTGTLPVESNHGQRNTVLLSVFLPLVLIALFLVNQQAKQQLRKRRMNAPPAAQV